MSPIPSPPGPLSPARTLDEVVETIDTIVDWSIAASNRLGYFAALYKRITIAVGMAVDQGAFEDGPRMERFDVVFANRYFDALNGHFHPQLYPRPTHSWSAVFAATPTTKPILVQHLVAGITAHIALDLGIAAAQISPGPKVRTLRNDFYTINAVLAGQVTDVVTRLNQLSPALGDLYALLGSSELFAINAAVRTMRDNAWRFTWLLAMEPAFARGATIRISDRGVSAQVMSVFDAPVLAAVSDAIIREIAERESRDIVRNIQVLDAVASTPPASIQTLL